jgi:hypothetical protein
VSFVVDLWLRGCALRLLETTVVCCAVHLVCSLGFAEPKLRFILREHEVRYRLT